jgi:predicted nucleic-acid-binding protein
MIADTNVLLRAFDEQDSDHRERARSSIRKARDCGQPLIVKAATFIEVEHVLRSEKTSYGWSRESICSALFAILGDPGLGVEENEVLTQAVHKYLVTNKGVSLHDCYLNACALEHSTTVISFDRDLQKLGNGVMP